MAPSPLDIKLEIIFNEELKYFPGYQIEGKVFLTANQNYTLRNFRLAWTGRIHVQPIQSNKDSRIYFDECWKLGSNLIKSPTKTLRGSSNVPFYITDLVLAHQECQEPAVELQKNKPLGLSFKVQVPNDRPLPSSTDAGTKPNQIIYRLEAFIDDHQISNNENPVFFTQKTVPVFEKIYTRTPEMTRPQRAEQVFIVSLFAEEKEFTSAMRVTLPCMGSQPGIAIPVSISIWNNMEFTRKQGISISLFRVNYVLANGRAYTSQDEKVHRVVTDLNITSENNDEKNQKVQKVLIGLPIPRNTMPTISSEQSQLLSVSYFIRVQVFAQEGVYTTTQGAKSQFMTIDLPFVVGTLAAPNTGSSPTLTNNNGSSPTLTNSSVSPIASPIPASTSLSSVLTQQQRELSNVDVSDTASTHRKSKSMGNIFRKSSTGNSSVSSEEKNKKKGIFSILRLYSGEKNNRNDSGCARSQRENQQQQVSPAVIMTPKQQQGGVFDIFAGDDVDDDDDVLKQLGQRDSMPDLAQYTAPSSELYSGSTSPPALAHKPVEAKNERFQMFPDDDSDDEQEEEEATIQEQRTAPIATFTEDEEINSTANNMENLKFDDRSNTQVVPQQSNVFNMFDDDDDDSDYEEEDMVDQLTISQERVAVLIDKRVKPHHQEENDKPNA